MGEVPRPLRVEGSGVVSYRHVATHFLWKLKINESTKNAINNEGKRVDGGVWSEANPSNIKINRYFITFCAGRYAANNQNIFKKLKLSINNITEFMKFQYNDKIVK